MTLAFDDLGVRVALYLDDPTDTPPPTTDEWAAWVDLESVIAETFSGTRWRMNRVPVDQLRKIVDLATRSRTANPHLLQLLQDAFIRLSGTTMTQLAHELRASFGLPDAELGPTPSTCSAADLEHDETGAAGAATDPQALVDHAVAELTTNGPEAIRESIEMATARGGRILWGPDRIRAPNGIAIRIGRDLHVGAVWLDAAVADITSTHANIAHELGGHLFYNRALSCRLITHALVGADEYPDSDEFQEVFQTYAYPETEVYAELKELPHRRANSIGDEPAADIALMIANIRAAYPTPIADLLLESMAYRFELDATLTDEARALFQELGV